MSNSTVNDSSNSSNPCNNCLWQLRAPEAYWEAAGAPTLSAKVAGLMHSPPCFKWKLLHFNRIYIGVMVGNMGMYYMGLIYTDYTPLFPTKNQQAFLREVCRHAGQRVRSEHQGQALQLSDLLKQKALCYYATAVFA